jgi:hypothetical protein
VRIYVGHAELVPDLIRFFEEQSDCVVLQVGESELEVSLLGSYRHDRHDAAVERLLARFWLQGGGAHGPRAVNGQN